MQQAIDLAVCKQDERGRRLLKDTFNARLRVKSEVKGESRQVAHA